MGTETAPDPLRATGVRVVGCGFGACATYDLMDGREALVLIDAVPGQEPGAVAVLKVGSDELGEGE